MKTKIFTKIKKMFKDAVDEHRYSVITFFVAMLIQAIIYDGTLGSFEKVEDFLEGLVFCLTASSFGALLCEAIHLYRKEAEDYVMKTPKNIIKYAGIILATAAASIQYYLLNVQGSFISESDNRNRYESISTNIMLCIMATVLGLTVYFFYKKSKESFESYLGKAFCGVMKAELVHGIISIGTALVLWAFDTLIVDIDEFDLIFRVEILLVALVQFPCIIAGISKTENSLGKFAKVILSYVFTTIEAIAFVIIYIYIIKILITWSFPSNQVFAILTALFSVGVFVWTMAQGCCDEALRKPLKIMPFLFIPFIVLQIMCLAMRVSNYGFTTSRYMGLVLIILELIYFGIYFVSVKNKKDIVALSIFVLIVAGYLVCFAPGLKYTSVVTASQKKRIENQLAKDASSAELYEAYKTVKYEGGFTGKKYLDSLSKEEVDKIEASSAVHYDGEDRETIYVYASSDEKTINIDGYSNLYMVNEDYDSTDDHFDYDVNALPIHVDGEEVGTVNLTDVLNRLIEIQESNDTDEDELSEAVIKEPIPLSSGGVLIIRWINSSSDRSNGNAIESIDFEGYVLK